jgi:hypothetical protein
VVSLFRKKLFAGLESFALHLQVDFNVSIGGLDGGSIDPVSV